MLSVNWINSLGSFSCRNEKSNCVASIWCAQNRTHIFDALRPATHYQSEAFIERFLDLQEDLASVHLK
jgi:hypothetical protein